MSFQSLINHYLQKNKIKKINPGLAQEDYKFGLQTGQPGRTGQTGQSGQSGQNGQARYLDWIGWIGPVGWEWDHFIEIFWIGKKSKFNQV